MRSSLGWPITLAVVMIGLLVALIIFWIVLTFRFWAVLATGTVFLVLVLVGVVLYLFISIKEIRLNRRQSNFIDSVSHELKSPIASLKLYLQTLARRNVTEAQQADFYRFMLGDVERLDGLINHMLDAARLDQEPVETDLADVELDRVLQSCAETACLRYHLPTSTIDLQLSPTVVRARPIDVEMVFRNLIDNAIKYGGREPKVEIHSQPIAGGKVVTQVIDNGEGIPAAQRRRIFGRFVRLGNELERSQKGTGLGLFIVRTLIKRLKGKITVRERPDGPGTLFQVELPTVAKLDAGNSRF
jgi:two-component system phosphate regulon sensor histidine kinase PhoR